MNSNKTLSIVASLILVPSAMIFSMSSAFAVVAASVQMIVPAGNGNSSQDSTACGTGHCYAKFSTNTANNSVTVHYGTDGNTCDLDSSTISGPGGPDSHFHNGISGYTYIWTSFDLNVDAGDKITVTNAYKNCN